ncbi:MAG: hypothetical protein ACE10E_02260 [Acidiferrobacterales bacterium]
MPNLAFAADAWARAFWLFRWFFKTQVPFEGLGAEVIGAAETQNVIRDNINKSTYLTMRDTQTNVLAKEEGKHTWKPNIFLL